MKHSILLVDGSLTAGTADNPAQDIKAFLDAAHESGNVVVAISKNSRICVSDKPITRILDEIRTPCILEIDSQVAERFGSRPLSFLGRVYVGKLSKSGFAFRIDVDRQVAPILAVDALQDLIGTEIVVQGYPETLRMAHILSTFTSSDVLALQASARSQFGIQLLPKFSVRRSLFGPFGTGWEGCH
jgi:hypothetical protein